MLTEQEMEGGNVRSFLTILFKHRVKIAACFLAANLFGAAVTFLLPPVFEARSTLLVKFGREYVYRPEVGERVFQINPSQEEMVNSEVRILTDRQLLAKVVKAVGVEQVYPELVKSYPRDVSPVDMAVLKFEKNLIVQGIRKSNVIEVLYRHKDPQRAAQMTNLLIEAFLDKRVDLYGDQKSSFLEQELAGYQQKLKESEERLQGFKQSFGVYSLDEQRNLLLKQQIDLDTLQKETNNRINELKEKLATLTAQERGIMEKAPLYTRSDRDRIITDAKAKLLELQMREQDLIVKYKENSRLVVNIRKEIELAKEFLKEQEQYIGERVRTGNPVYEEVEKERLKAQADLKAQEAKAVSLKRQVDRLEGEIRRLDLREKELQDLKRQQSINDKNYRTYFDKFEEARILDDMNRKKLANISVIQKALPPAKPIRPRKALNLGLSVTLGLALGLIAALVSEYLSQGMSTPESAEKRLQLSVLASIPYYDRPG